MWQYVTRAKNTILLKVQIFYFLLYYDNYFKQVLINFFIENAFYVTKKKLYFLIILFCYKASITKFYQLLGKFIQLRLNIFYLHYQLQGYNLRSKCQHIKTQVKNAFNFENEDDTVAVNEVTGEKLLNRDLFSLNGAKVTVKLVEYYVNLQYKKKINFTNADICYILPVTNISNVNEATIADEVCYVVGCYRMSSDSWISVVSFCFSQFLCCKSCS